MKPWFPTVQHGVLSFEHAPTIIIREDMKEMNCELKSGEEMTYRKQMDATQRQVHTSIATSYIR